MALIDDGSVYGNFGQMHALSATSGNAPQAPAQPQAPQAQPKQQIQKTYQRGDPTVLAVQRALAARGMFNGTAHGVLDQATVEAVKAFKRSVGLPVTGDITPLLVRDLGITDTPPVPEGYGAGAGGPPPTGPVVLQNGQPDPNAPPQSPAGPMFKLLAIAAAATGLMYWLSKRSKKARMREAYADVAGPDDFDEDDFDDSEDGEPVEIPKDSHVESDEDES